MTIKKRLFVSNILMIIIPAIVSIFVVLCVAVIFRNLFYRQFAREILDNKRLLYIQDNVVSYAEEIIRTNDESIKADVYKRAEKYLNDNNARLEIYRGDEIIYSSGHESHDYDFLKAVRAAGREGIIFIDGNFVYSENITAGNNDYLICIYSSMKNGNSESSEYLIKGIVALLFVFVIIAVIITNRFLTKFVFKKVETPLYILADGVNEIKNGNLDYRIDYKEKDEFYPVCEAFNDIAVRLKASVEGTRHQEENRKELIAGISHDIRTPLTSIKAYIEGILDGVASTPELRLKYMRTIREKANDIDKMVDKLFLFSKLDLGDYPFYIEKIDVDSEIRKLISENEYEKKNMNISIENTDESLEIYADTVQFRNAVTNILENSLKYKDSELVNVKIRYINSDDNLKIIIEDDGPGVPKEAVDKLFNVFYRSDPSRNNPNKGSGLGLAITAKILERLGGSIYAENIYPKGLGITMVFPKDKGDENG